jgi:hypothetical protein
MTSPAFNQLPDGRTKAERILSVVREASQNGASWVTLADLRSRADFRPEDYNALGVVLARMERRGEIAVDRSLGFHRRRFALMTPGELERLLTQFALLAKFDFDALTARTTLRNLERAREGER